VPTDTVGYHVAVTDVSDPGVVVAPRMIPPRYLADYRSSGEELVYEELHSKAPDDWIVLHSLDIAPAPDRIRAEADFVVIIPRLGAAVIEVKSVAQQTPDRQWDYGRGVVSTRGPFEQADRAMRALLSYFESIGAKRRPFMCSGVVTPFGDITTQVHSQQTIEWNEWQAIGRSALQASGLVACIERLVRKEGEAEGRGFMDFDANAIANLLRPRFEFYLSPAARREQRESETRHYTEEQFDVLDDLEANGQMLVMGPAGCGKTLLGLELVRRATLEDRRVLFVCFNRPLGDWLGEQVRPLGHLAIATSLDQFMLKIAGIRSVPADDPRFWTEDLPFAAASRFSTMQQPFDLLIVDESQDMLSPDRLLFLNECVAGGLSEGQWVFFGDFEGQAVQVAEGGHDVPGLLESATGRRPYTRRLRRNCRNTQRVAQFAEAIADLPVEYRYSACLRPDLGEVPSVIPLGPDDDSTVVLAAVLGGLLEDGYKNDEIVVLSIGAADSSTASRLARQERWRDLLAPAHRQIANRIRFDSVRRFKGLEAAVVVVTDLDARVGEASLRDLLYVAATRSVGQVVILAAEGAAAEIGLR